MQFGRRWGFRRERGGHLSGAFGGGEYVNFVAMNQPVNPFEFAAASASLSADATPAPWVRLLPNGTFTLRDGRGPFRAGDNAAELSQVIDRSLAYASNTELMMDYDHQSYFAVKPGVGGTAVASGWIKKLDARADGIWGRIEWTDAAAAKIKASEYRYISPLFTYDDAGNINRLINAALVNVPAIDFTAIAASLLTHKEPVPMKTIAKFLGLAETSSEEAILAAMTSNQQSLAAAAGLAKDIAFTSIVAGVTGLVADRVKLVTAAGLKLDATAEQVVAAMATIGAKAGDTVPKASFDQLSAQFADLKKSVETGSVERTVAAAIEQGKVTPANKEWATAYCASDPKGFDTFVQNAPVLTEQQLGDKKTPASSEINPTELAAAANVYMREQHAAGNNISYAAAVITVRDQKK